MGWATADEEESQSEYEAQRDMLAYVQSTFPYRFGSDLQAGDFVQYEISDHHSQGEEPEQCSLMVQERNGIVVTVMEQFEGNTLYYRIDLQSNILLEYWGFDEDGIEQRPALLSSSEVETRMQTIKSQNFGTSTHTLPQSISKPLFTSLAQRETFSTGRSSIDCLVRALDIPVVEGITPQVRQAVQELSKVYFSESVPKLLPAKFMAVYLDNPELFEGNAGLVKQSKYQVSDFYRVDR